jgi:hypothetical protein
MRKVKLYTRGNPGGLVVELEMPVFNPMADGILWGERFFVPDMATADGALTYVEGMLWVAPISTAGPQK